MSITPTVFYRTLNVEGPGNLLSRSRSPAGREPLIHEPKGTDASSVARSASTNEGYLSSFCCVVLRSNTLHWLYALSNG